MMKSPCIVYEGRAAKVLLDNAKLQEIEEYYKQCEEEGASMPLKRARRRTLR